MWLRCIGTCLAGHLSVGVCCHERGCMTSQANKSLSDTEDCLAPKYFPMMLLLLAIMSMHTVSLAGIAL